EWCEANYSPSKEHFHERHMKNARPTSPVNGCIECSWDAVERGGVWVYLGTRNERDCPTGCAGSTRRSIPQTCATAIPSWPSTERKPSYKVGASMGERCFMKRNSIILVTLILCTALASAQQPLTDWPCCRGPRA